MSNSDLVNNLAVLCLASCVSMGISNYAHAQSAKEADQQPGWTVNCASGPELKNLQCLMAQEIHLRQTGQRLVRMQVNLTAETQQPFVTISLPHGVLFGQGIALQIDKGETITLPINSGDQNGSYVRQKLDKSLLDALRGGKLASLTMTTLNKQKLKVGISLAGFSKALDMVFGAEKL